MKQEKTKEELQIEIDQLKSKIAEFENTEFNSSTCLDNSPVCTKIVDLDFNLQYMSNAGVSALQIDDVSAFYGKPYPLSFFPDAYKSAMYENLLRAKEKGETIIQEGEILDVKGNGLWFQATITPVYNKQGVIDHLLVVSIDTLARKQAEEALKENELFLKQTQETAKVGGWSYNIATGESKFTNETSKIYGLPIGTIPSTEDGIKFYHPDDRGIISAAFSKAITEGKPYDLEVRFINAQGENLFVRTIGSSLIENGKVVKLTGAILDISEQKKAEEKLKESEKKYRELVNLAQEGIWVIDKHSATSFVNPSMAKMLGYSADEMEGKSLFDFMDETGVKIANENLERRQAGIKDQHDFEFICKNGDRMIASLETAPIMDKLGNYDGAIAGVINITKRKQAEEKLKESEKRFRAIYNNTPALLHSLDENGVLISVSDFWLKTLGYEKSEVLGKPSSMFLTESSKRYARDIAFPKFHENDFITNAPYQFVKKNGEVMDVLLSAILIRDNLGEMNRSLAVLMDITDLKKAEKDLKESEERFELAMTASKDGVFDWNLLTNEIYYSPGWKGMLGYGDDELPNDFSVWEKLIELEDLEKSWKMQQELISKQRDRFELEFKMKHKEGHWVDILSRAEAVFDENDKAIRIVGTHVDISERKKADEKLVKEKKIFEDLFNNINSGVAIYKVINDGEFGKDYIIENFNDKSLELEGQTRKEVVGKSLYDLRPNIDDFGIIPEFRKVWKTGIGRMYPSKVYVDENYSNYYENKIFKLPNNNIVAIYDDVTVRMQAEDKIRVAEENLKNTFNISPSIIAKANLNTGYFIEASQAVTRILGYSVEEFTSKPLMEFIHPEDRQRTTDESSEQLKGNETTFFENRYLCKDGSCKWLAWHVTKADENGIVTAIGADINKRKKAEGDVRRLSTAVQQSPLMIVITDTKGKLEYVNPKFTKITRYSSAEAIGQKSNILKSGEQDAAFYTEMWKTIDAGKEWHGQFKNRKKNGELFWEAASISAVLNEAGEVINFIKIGEDITQQKQTEIELQQALEKALESDRLKSAFLSNMSHEIRTPMNGILGFTELLQDADLSVENQKSYIEIIEKSGDRLLNTVNDIIEISKIESGEVKKSVNEINFLDHLKTLVTFFTPEIKKKGLEISIDNEISGLDKVILTDKNKLSSVFSNLIKNSIKYTNEGFIKVGFKLNEGQLIFYCKDSGIGIPKNRQKAIFNRFEQADIEDKQAHQGSGLGLAIVKSYVEMLNGKIWVESEEGKGSIFYVALPYNPVKSKQNDLSLKSEFSGLDKKNINVLIVEDDEISLLHLSVLLNKFAQSAITVQNGIEAVDTIRNDSSINLILMDMKMPKMDGFEATKKIRGFNKDVVIIAQTAYAFKEDKQKALDAGCNDYVSKPINKKKLVEIINLYF